MSDDGQSTASEAPADAETPQLSLDDLSLPADPSGAGADASGDPTDPTATAADDVAKQEDAQAGESPSADKPKATDEVATLKAEIAELRKLVTAPPKPAETPKVKPDAGDDKAVETRRAASYTSFCEQQDSILAKTMTGEDGMLATKGITDQIVKLAQAATAADMRSLRDELAQSKANYSAFQQAIQATFGDDMETRAWTSTIKGDLEAAGYEPDQVTEITGQWQAVRTAFEALPDSPNRYHIALNKVLRGHLTKQAQGVAPVPAAKTARVVPVVAPALASPHATSPRSVGVTPPAPNNQPLAPMPYMGLDWRKTAQ
jgi:hypothetical protein